MERLERFPQDILKVKGRQAVTVVIWKGYPFAMKGEAYQGIRFSVRWAPVLSQNQNGK